VTEEAWCDWRRNTDIAIRCWNYSKEADLGENSNVVGFVDYAKKEIFIGSPYGYVFDSGGISNNEMYEDVDYITDLIAHEMIHLILAKKVDYYEHWEDPEQGDIYFATHGWDRIQGSLDDLIG